MGQRTPMAGSLTASRRERPVRPGLDRRRRPPPRWSAGTALAVWTAVVGAGCAGTDWTAPRWGRQQSRTEGEQWTILCVEAYGQEGQAVVEALAKGLQGIQRLDPNQVRTTRGEEHSRLYYGAYVRRYDERMVEGRFPPAMRQDMEFIRQLFVNDTYPFLHARPVPVEERDPGPPEWDLCRARGDYTLLVGVFSEIPDRRKLALEHVKLLREQGAEAYYYHDLGKSHVCVGTFSEDDLKPTGRGVPRIDHPRFVMLKGQHPYFAYNGRYVSSVTRNAQGKIVSRVRQPTRLVRIPRNGEGGIP